MYFYTPLNKYIIACFPPSCQGEETLGVPWFCPVRHWPWAQFSWRSGVPNVNSLRSYPAQKLRKLHEETFFLNHPQHNTMKAMISIKIQGCGQPIVRLSI